MSWRYQKVVLALVICIISATALIHLREERKRKRKTLATHRSAISLFLMSAAKRPSPAGNFTIGGNPPNALQVMGLPDP